MIKRYTLPEMGSNWSDANKFLQMTRVEIAVLEAQAELGLIPVSVPPGLIDKITIDVAKIDKIENEVTHHDVIAFLQVISPQMPVTLQPYLHQGLTSNDPQDTALSLMLQKSVDLLLGRLDRLAAVLKDKALYYLYTPQIGRTHMVHAQPITFGVKLANWYDECMRNRRRLLNLRELVSVGKIAGPVGVYTLPPEVEEIVCRKLGLEPITGTQVIPRDIHAEYLATLAIIGGSLAKFADAIRSMQSTEIREAQEYFSPGQKGSSAMPHKRNPLTSEKVKGLARTLRSYAITGFEDQETDHERNLTNSAPERVVLPDASILLDYMLQKFTRVIQKLIVYPERMLHNLSLTRGLIYSEAVMNLVATKSGLPREQAYDLVQVVAQKCWDESTDFLEQLLQNEPIMAVVSEVELRACFSLEDKLKYVDYIFARVFPPTSAPA